MGPKISLIAAIGQNRELGAGNELMWHLPDDFAWFVRHTKGHPVVMGRKTMESLGKPLRNRRNIVVTRNPQLTNEGFEVFPGLSEALSSARETESEEIFVIGGGQIYAQALPMADRLYITEVHASFPGADTFFPEYGNEWEKTFSQFHPKDEKHAQTFEYLILEKKTE
jgi:dihydrofolate reductase